MQLQELARRVKVAKECFVEVVGAKIEELMLGGDVVAGGARARACTCVRQVGERERERRERKREERAKERGEREERRRTLQSETEKTRARHKRARCTVRKQADAHDCR